MTQPILKGRYAIDKVFADGGGMGVIYAARDLKCADNEVLVKTTRYDGGVNARHFKYSQQQAVEHVEKLRKIIAWEKKMLIRFAEINNLPSINDYFLADSMLLQPHYDTKLGGFELPNTVLQNEPYLVMERIYGKTLQHAMRSAAFRDEQFEWRVLQMAKEVLSILIKLHRPIDVGQQKGHFIYQDLKPANILVSPGDYFTLIDMGAVTLRLGNRTTEPTSGCITIGYAAPEGATAGAANIDARFDLYTLGVTMWEVFTQQDPQELGGEFPEIPLEPLRALGLHRATLDLIQRALARQPSARFQSAAEMRKATLEAIHSVRSGQP